MRPLSRRGRPAFGRRPPHVPRWSGSSTWTGLRILETSGIIDLSSGIDELRDQRSSQRTDGDAPTSRRCARGARASRITARAPRRSPNLLPSRPPKPSDLFAITTSESESGRALRLASAVELRGKLRLPRPPELRSASGCPALESGTADAGDAAGTQVSRALGLPPHQTATRAERARPGPRGARPSPGRAHAHPLRPQTKRVLPPGTTGTSPAPAKPASRSMRATSSGSGSPYRLRWQRRKRSKLATLAAVPEQAREAIAGGDRGLDRDDAARRELLADAPEQRRALGGREVVERLVQQREVEALGAERRAVRKSPARISPRRETCASRSVRRACSATAGSSSTPTPRASR